MEQENNNQTVFNIEKLYVKDLSAEVPNAPQAFLERETPNVAIELATSANAIDEGFYEVALKATVTASIGEDKTLFLVECTQAGVFQIRNVQQAELEPVLMIGCANILFPYARETISDAVTRAGFQPVLLAPVNFEAMYQARLQQQAAAQTPVQ